ncbi:MAG: Stp1/IreP family PP2C-type Ser/Thr phosphatase [Firmicutes bacterium]|jgi:protein phosphatase|nr:Stp1/IreP family PP2C-type Ser/Thr phosphatase [Bacillota bacterium]
MECSAFTHPGLVRPSNEDSFCLKELGESSAVLAVVADGMGGHEGGEIASRIAVSAIESVVTASWKTHLDPGACLSIVADGVAAANRLIQEESIKRYGTRCMGTTVTAAVIHGNRVHLGHAGDSRAYLISRYGISQVTEDHSIVGEMMRDGNLTEAEAMRHPGRNILTNALGTSDYPRLDLHTEALEQGDIVLLCTDGLTNLVSREEILGVARGCPSLDVLVRSLVDLANARGGYDNTTVVAVRFRDGG